MATYDQRSSARRADLLYAVNALLALKRRHGWSAVKEAIQMAQESTLEICSVCADWTRHQNGKCQQCADF